MRNTSITTMTTSGRAISDSFTKSAINWTRRPRATRQPWSERNRPVGIGACDTGQGAPNSARTSPRLMWFFLASHL